jgi:hypothetical protein
MIVQAGDLGVELDSGDNTVGAVLLRLEAGEWKPYLKDGKPLTWTVDYTTLPPGKYRAAEK